MFLKCQVPLILDVTIFFKIGLYNIYFYVVNKAWPGLPINFTKVKVAV